MEEEWDVLALLNTCECVAKECRDIPTLVARATDTASVKNDNLTRSKI